MLLRLENCSLAFGGIKALTAFTAGLESGEILGIIGPNGAGKTTLFNILTGVYSPDQGYILFDGTPITGHPSFKINRLGVGRTFQNIRLFQNLTVEENVLIGFCHGIKTQLWETFFRTKRLSNEEKILREKTMELLCLFGLQSKKEELAKNLPYGDQRKLEIVRALATRPRLLLLDEPAAGMNATEKQELLNLIGQIHRDYHLAIILIEHDMSVVMTLCPRIIVLDYGVILAEGTPTEIRTNPKVIEAYLGETP